MNSGPATHANRKPALDKGGDAAKNEAIAPAPKPGIHRLGKTNFVTNVISDEIVRDLSGRLFTSNEN
jgi:hypothetical protein